MCGRDGGGDSDCGDCGDCGGCGACMGGDLGDKALVSSLTTGEYLTTCHMTLMQIKP